MTGTVRVMHRGIWREAAADLDEALTPDAERAVLSLAELLARSGGDEVLVAESLAWPGLSVVRAACATAGAVLNVPESPAFVIAASRAIAPRVLVLTAARAETLARSGLAEAAVRGGLGGLALRRIADGDGSGPAAGPVRLVRRLARRRYGWTRLRLACLVGGQPTVCAHGWFDQLGVAVGNVSWDGEA